MGFSEGINSENYAGRLHLGTDSDQIRKKVKIKCKDGKS